MTNAPNPLPADFCVCDHAQYLISERSDRVLSRQEELSLASHLDDCARCSQFGRTLDRVTPQLRRFRKGPDRMSRRLGAMLGATLVVLLCIGLLWDHGEPTLEGEKVASPSSALKPKSTAATAPEAIAEESPIEDKRPVFEPDVVAGAPGRATSVPSEPPPVVTNHDRLLAKLLTGTDVARQTEARNLAQSKDPANLPVLREAYRRTKDARIRADIALACSKCGAPLAEVVSIVCEESDGHVVYCALVGLTDRELPDVFLQRLVARATDPFIVGRVQIIRFLQLVMPRERFVPISRSLFAQSTPIEQLQLVHLLDRPEDIHLLRALRHKLPAGAPRRIDLAARLESLGDRQDIAKWLTTGTETNMNRVVMMRGMLHARLNGSGPDAVASVFAVRRKASEFWRGEIAFVLSKFGPELPAAHVAACLNEATGARERAMLAIAVIQHDRGFLHRELQVLPPEILDDVASRLKLAGGTALLDKLRRGAWIPSGAEINAIRYALDKYLSKRHLSKNRRLSPK